jgi:hypothetical protein
MSWPVSHSCPTPLVATHRSLAAGAPRRQAPGLSLLSFSKLSPRAVAQAQPIRRRMSPPWQRSARMHSLPRLSQLAARLTRGCAAARRCAKYSGPASRTCLDPPASSIPALILVRSCVRSSTRMGHVRRRCEGSATLPCHLASTHGGRGGASRGKQRTYALRPRRNTPASPVQGTRRLRHRCSRSARHPCRLDGGQRQPQTTLLGAAEQPQGSGRLRAPRPRPKEGLARPLYPRKLLGLVSSAFSRGSARTWQQIDFENAENSAPARVL